MHANAQAHALNKRAQQDLRHHKAATALHYGFYNLCRINEAMRVTPAMAAGISERVWSVGELLDAALTGEVK